MQFPTATAEEISALKKLVKRVDSLERTEAYKDGTKLATSEVTRKQQSEIEVTEQPRKVKEHNKPSKPVSLFDGGIQNVEITREPLNIDNPVKWGLLIMPELTPYRWQFELLMITGGYLTPGDYTHKTIVDDNNPLLLAIPAANGSGKDMVLIAWFATWMAVTGKRNRVIITSSSFDQLKFQTDPHIRKVADSANAKFGRIFRYTQFHYLTPELGGEIKLYATDEPKRAEGYHPYPGGKMALIVNEAKSVTPGIFDAIDRCTGYSYKMLISSPGPRNGYFYEAATQNGVIHYPNPPQLGRYYSRRVPASECPHLSKSHIDAMREKRGENDPWFLSSIEALFSDYDEPVVIPEFVFTKCLEAVVQPHGIDIGIGADFAGGGDENGVMVRKGNRIVFHYFFTNPDSMASARLIDMQLSPWKDAPYIFNADNGGIGQAFIDHLRELGWNITRRNNQSAAFRKSEFLNLGAEMWFHTKRLMERLQIIIPPNIPKLRDQMTNRYYKGFDTTQGRLALESKAEARAAGRKSPDRADTFVLAFFSYRPGSIITTEKKEDPSKRYEERIVPQAQFEEMFEKGQLKRYDPSITSSGRFTTYRKI